jgi:electron transfer flavoprotein alpha subunit
MSSYKNPRAGLREEEPRPSASAGGCPNVYGGGNNCCVGRLTAGLREHDPGFPIPDTDCAGGLRLRGGGKEEEKKQIFRPRSTLARSPVQKEGIDLNASEIQVMPIGRTSGPARDSSGRFQPRGQGKDCPAEAPEEVSRPGLHLAAYAERGEAPNVESALSPVLPPAGGGEARFEKVAQVVLTRLAEGILLPGDPARDADTDETMFSARSVSPAGAGTGTGTGADMEGRRPSCGAEAKTKSVSGRRARKYAPTPFKFGTPPESRESSVDSPMPRSDAEDFPGVAGAPCGARTGPSSQGADLQPPRGRLWQSPRKRRRLQDEDEDEDESSQSVASGSSPSVARGSGHPTADKAYKATRDDPEAEREGAAGVLRMSSPRPQRGCIKLTTDSAAGDLSLASLTQRVQGSLESVALVATKSGNLKGTSVKALKDSVTSIREVFEVLIERTSSEETRRLQAQNDRLREELTELRSEMVQLRREVQAQHKRQSPNSAPAKENTLPASETTSMDNVVRSITAQVGLMLDARFGALEIEGRLLPAQPTRPSLGADRKRQAERAASQSRESPSASASESAPAPAPKPAPKRGPPNLTEEPRKGKGDKGKTNKKKAKKLTLAAVEASAARRDVPETSRPLPPAPKTTETPWNMAVGNGAKSLGNPKAAKNTPPARSKARKLRPPRSAAIVLTLRPDAEEKGVTYGQVLARAKESINLESLGISAVKFKRAATGARVLEVPGTASGEKADSLAKELAEKLGQDVRISRPVMSAELRLTQLDDSVSTGEVVAAVAKAGGCEESHIKAGEIRQDVSGLGSIWLRCPVAAAKKVVEADRGRLQVGWVRATVKLLDKRPMRCFKCLEKGHVRAQCASEVDRSNVCYRCGKPGHRAGECSAPPHCVVCADAGKKADHGLGSKPCLTSRPNTARKKAGASPRAPPQPSQPSDSRPDAHEENQMATE